MVLCGSEWAWMWVGVGDTSPPSLVARPVWFTSRGVTVLCVNISLEVEDERQGFSRESY